MVGEAERWFPVPMPGWEGGERGGAGGSNAAAASAHWVELLAGKMMVRNRSDAADTCTAEMCALCLQEVIPSSARNDRHLWTTVPGIFRLSRQSPVVELLARIAVARLPCAKEERYSRSLSNPKVQPGEAKSCDLNHTTSLACLIFRYT